jgi:phosphoribosyl 1,2-cyclic phosphodiesterase
VKVRFWGARGSIATPGPETDRYGGNTPCVTVEQKENLLILDAGTGIRRLGLALQAEAAGSPLELHLLITHTHWDHIQGFPFFVPAFVPHNIIHIYGMPPSEKPLEKVLSWQMESEYFPVAMGELAARLIFHEVREDPFQIGPFAISWAYMNHPGITLGYRVTAGGKTVTYATDTEPFRRLLADHKPTASVGETYGGSRDQEIVRLAHEADLYIADAQYTPEEYEKKHGWGHTSSTDAVHLAIEAGAKRLALFHHDPMHDDAAIDKHVERARLLANVAGSPLEIFAAAENQELML